MILNTASSIKPSLPALAEHRTLRFITSALLYFMQGVPIGISMIAIPAWLAANGASPVQVGAFVGFAALPWSLKPFAGIVMDRFTFRPMGRRRSWILIGQASMVVVLLALAMTAPAPGEISLLAGFCFALNLCAILNDVAVDGMTIDIVPENERTAINGVMLGSQTLGISATALVAGRLLAPHGFGLTALVLAGFVAAASLFVACFRERAGERLLPWSKGEASEACLAQQHDTLKPILTGLMRAFAVPATALFLLATFLSIAVFGFTDAVAPTLAVQGLGWTSEAYSNLGAIVNLVAGVLALFAPMLIERILGRTRAPVALMLLVLVSALAGAGMYALGPLDGHVFTVLFVLFYVPAILTNVLLIAWAMRLCDPAVAASQFALFMAIPNFGRSLMASGGGWLAGAEGYDATLVAVAVFMFLAMLLLVISSRLAHRVHQPTTRAIIGQDA